jgi:hypothetical protein
VALDGRALPRAMGDAVTWFKTDDGFPEHPKADALAEHFGTSWQLLHLAFAAWHHLGCDCAARRTDGVFAASRAYRVLRAPRREVDRALAGLVAVGLLTRDGEVYTYHDWSEYQPTRAQLDAERAAKTERQNRWRAGKTPSVDGRVDASTRRLIDGRVDASVDAAPSRPDPTRPDPTKEAPLPPAVGKLSAADVDDVLQRESGGRIDVRSANGPKLALLALLGEMAVTPTELAVAAKLCRTPSAVWPWAEGLKADRSRVTVTWLVGGEGAPRLHELVAAARAASPPPMPTPRPTLSDAQMRRLSPFAGLLERTRTHD